MAANLPIFNTPDTQMTQMQTTWKAAISPVIQNELNQGQLLKNIKLVAGDNTINHKLSRMQVGYILCDKDSAASIYRSKPLNDTTLTLNSTGPCTIAIWVF